MNPVPTVHVDEVTQTYGSLIALDSVSFQLFEGVTALLGPNGAGKSTLLRTIVGIQPPTAGLVHISGRPINSERAARQARRNIGYLPQGFGYDPAMRVEDFVLYGAWLRGVASAEVSRAVDEALTQVDLRRNRRDKMRRLSGGMRQRAAIAWTIVGRPNILVLDEPTVGLDPQQRIQFRQILSGLEATTVLLSTHLTDDVEAICDNVLLLKDGSLVFDDITDGLRAAAHPDAPGNTPLEKAYMKLLSKDGA